MDENNIFAAREPASATPPTPIRCSRCGEPAKIAWVECSECARPELSGRVAELEAQLAEAKAENEALQYEAGDKCLQLAEVRAALIETIEDATEGAEAAIQRAEAAEKEVERLGEIVTECDGVECTKHDVLLRVAIQLRKQAEAQLAEANDAKEIAECEAYQYSTRVAELELGAKAAALMRQCDTPCSSEWDATDAIMGDVG